MVSGGFQGESRFSQVEVDELQLAAGEGFLTGMVSGGFQGESRFSQVEVDELQLAAGEGFLTGMVSGGFQGVEQRCALGDPAHQMTHGYFRRTVRKIEKGCFGLIHEWFLV
jgi:uncharacterized protein YgfB (UPF0149 family)